MLTIRPTRGAHQQKPCTYSPNQSNGIGQLVGPVFFVSFLETKVSKVDVIVTTMYLVVVAVGSTFHSSTPVDAPTASRLLQ